ncbi:MAG: hypothetical protein GTO02_17975 [Candidatus Dadabacteria bacterium]|nr:hypothetical protein [Candidatus Dadabacteria bacterium]NIQ16203.1 hypothetical protein [Candidatus Dadabacteria bacterium]
MKILVKGQIYPKVWDIANSVKKLRDERKNVNLGSGTLGYSVYEVTLPNNTEKKGNYLTTPSGVRLYFNSGDQYQIGYLISEIDNDPAVLKHFTR